MVITESQLTPERLGAAIADILGDPEKTARMGAAARRLAVPDATQKIVNCIEKIQKSV